MCIRDRIDTDKLFVNQPADFWNQNSSYIGFESSNQDIGSITTSGGFATSIYSNGYRDDTNNWQSLGVDGNLGGVVLELGPAGGLTFKASADTTQYADGQHPGITRFSINTDASDDSADAVINASTVIRGKGVTSGNILRDLLVQTTTNDNETTATLAKNIESLASGNNPSVTDIELFKVNKASTFDSTNVVNTKGLAIEGLTDGGENVYGVWSNLGTGSTNNYNFFAAATAKHTLSLIHI